MPWREISIWCIISEGTVKHYNCEASSRLLVLEICRFPFASLHGGYGRHRRRTHSISDGVAWMFQWAHDQRLFCLHDHRVGHDETWLRYGKVPCDMALATLE